jgi:hypothetical protein
MNICHVERSETSLESPWHAASPDGPGFFSRDRGIRMTTRNP